MSGLVQPVVLVIDADPVSMLATAATLHGEHFEVHCAQGMGPALLAAQENSIDLVVCDVDLDGESGIDVVLAINALPNRSDVPALFISSSQMADVVSRRFRNGSALFLRRPFTPKLLVDLCDKALWMPHLVKTHISRPHMPVPASGSASLRQSAALSADIPVS